MTDKSPVILIAEDESTVGALYKAHFAREFPKVKTVLTESVADCKAAIHHYGSRIKIIILDGQISPERQDGFELAENIRDGHLGPDIQQVPIAIISTNIQHVDRNPPVFYFPKPFNSQELLPFVREQIYGSDKRRQEINEAKLSHSGEDAQASRDHNARCLISALHPEEKDIPYELIYKLEYEPTHTAYDVARTRITVLNSLFAAAFKDGTPSKPLMVQLKMLLDKEKYLYIGDDNLAAQYSLFKGEIKAKLYEALKSGPVIEL